MTTLRTTVHFDAPIERVFARFVDFKSYPEWHVNNPEILEVTGPPAAGTRIHSGWRVLGRRFQGWAAITAIVPPRFLQTNAVSFEGGDLQVEVTLTPVGSGTDVEIDIDYELPAGLLGHLFDGLFIERTIERDVRHSMENLGALVEARQHVFA
jgi:uncharacterized protein YndB with AHSA1/START domain